MSKLDEINCLDNSGIGQSTTQIVNLSINNHQLTLEIQQVEILEMEGAETVTLQEQQDLLLEEATESNHSNNFKNNKSKNNNNYNTNYNNNNNNNYSNNNYKNSNNNNYRNNNNNNNSNIDNSNSESFDIAEEKQIKYSNSIKKKVLKNNQQQQKINISPNKNNSNNKNSFSNCNNSNNNSEINNSSNSEEKMNISDWKKELNNKLANSNFSPSSPGLTYSSNNNNSSSSKPNRPLPKAPSFTLSTGSVGSGPVSAPNSPSTFDQDNISSATNTPYANSPIASPSISSRKTQPKPISGHLKNFKNKPLPMTPPQISSPSLTKLVQNTPNSPYSSNLLEEFNNINNNNSESNINNDQEEVEEEEQNETKSDKQQQQSSNIVPKLDLNIQLNESLSIDSAPSSTLSQSIDPNNHSGNYTPSSKSISSEITLRIIFYVNNTTQSAPSSPVISSNSSSNSPSQQSKLHSSSDRNQRPQSTNLKSLLWRSTPNMASQVNNSNTPSSPSQQVQQQQQPQPTTTSSLSSSQQRIEKLFKLSPCSTVDEVLGLVIPNLVHHKGLQKAKHTSNDEWEPENIDSEGTVTTANVSSTPINGEHHSYALFRRDNPLVPLHKEKTLLELGLEDQETIELKTIVLNIQFVKIHIPCFTEDQQPANATLKLTQFTSIRSIIRKLYLKFHQSIDVSQYGIFLQKQSENTEMLLEEDELFSTYHITGQSNLVFRNLSTLTETMILESKSLQLRFLVTTANTRRTQMELSFNPNILISKAIKMTGLRAGLLDSVNKCGFYLTPSEDDDDGFWMDEEQTLSSYHLQNMTTLEFKQRCRKYVVAIKPSERKVIFKFDQYTTVQSMFNIIVFNEGIANVKDYCLTFKDSGIILDMNRYLWSYDQDKEIEFKENANRLYIFGKDGEQNLVFVDFNDPLEDVCKRLSTHLGFRRERAYTLKKLGEAENDLMDAKLSLKQHGVQPNDRVVIEVQNTATTNDANGNGTSATTTPSTPDSKVSESPDNSSSSSLSTLAAMGEQLDEKSNLNIWEEPADSPMNVVYSKSKSPDDLYPPIDAGTLNKLIIRLTSENTHDLMFMKALLMTYSSYTSAQVLLSKLFERFRVPAEADIDEREKQSIQLRVANVIKYWVEHHYEDFGYSTTKMMVDFVDTHMMQAFPQLGNQIRGCILKRTCGIKGELTRTRSNGTLTSPRPAFLNQSNQNNNNNNNNNNSRIIKKAKKPLNQSNQSNGLSSSQTISSTNSLTSSNNNNVLNSPLSSSPRKRPEIKSKGIKNARSIFDFDDEEIARQLTLFDFMLYSAIRQTEFLNQAWNKPAIAARRSPTILQMINRFNEVGLWVVKLILEPERVKTRAKRMERVIRIAEKLRELKNFNTLMAFLGGLNNSAILRLKFTKGLVGKKYMESLESLEREMTCESAYKTYRELLHNTDPPCVPYIGVYLTDLTFIEEGNPNIIGNNLINFAKYTLLYKVISEVQQYQWSEYNLNYVPIIQTFIKDLNPPSVAELYQISLQKEPKGAQKSDIF